MNISTSQFERQADSVSKIGLPPGGLQLEITERAVMDKAEFALGKLKQPRDLGIGFAIDAYGTGYSCLYYLERMPVNSLKIDRSFVAGLGRDRETRRSYPARSTWPTPWTSRLLQRAWKPQSNSRNSGILGATWRRASSSLRRFEARRSPAFWPAERRLPRAMAPGTATSED